jgi:hypothetical protein
MTTQIKLHESVASSAETKKIGKKFRSLIVAADRWGSSAYYPAEVLERDGSRVFHAGVQMYADHQKESEKWDQPERSIDRLVGSLASDAVFEANGEEGPGLYADVEFHESFVNRINELKKDVGLSINATGLTEDAEMDGRYGPVLVGLLAADSVDVVTRAGAGGKLVSIIESDRGLAGRELTESGKDQSVTDVTKEDFEALSKTLIEAINAIPGALAESLKPAAEVQPTAEELAAKAAAEGKPEDKDEVTVDATEVATAVIEAKLPASAIAPVAAAVKEGKTLEEAVKIQTDYRDSLIEATEVGTVTRINESDKPKGLAYAVAKLNS